MLRCEIPYGLGQNESGTQRHGDGIPKNLYDFGTFLRNSIRAGWLALMEHNEWVQWFGAKMEAPASTVRERPVAKGNRREASRHRRRRAGAPPARERTHVAPTVSCP